MWLCIILTQRKARYARVQTHEQAKVPTVEGLIQTRIAMQRMPGNGAAPEQHDVRLGTVDGVVYPATALLNSKLSPLILQRRLMMRHCSGRKEGLGTKGGLRISLRSGGRPSGGTWRFPAAGQRACEAGKTRV